jgi:hypothetical protein
MNRDGVEQIARAVLYEGYILYPYRPSVKNRQRWTFGGLYPEELCDASAGENCMCQSEVLVTGDGATRFEANVRFLHLTARQAGAVDPPLASWPASEEPAYQPVEALRIGDRLLQTWQEAEERTVSLEPIALNNLIDCAREQAFSFTGDRRLEPVSNADGQIAGVLVREKETVTGTIELSASVVAENVFRVRVRIRNRTPCPKQQNSREQIALRSLASTHMIFGVDCGSFVSLTDPPPGLCEAARACQNTGGWPVLVGEEGATDTVLFSPIILSDYPQIAPESPGDFFDGTEIDEMLTLRILTLTDEEKRAMAAVDSRAGELLARTEARAREHLLSLHGTVRGQ